MYLNTKMIDWYLKIIMLELFIRIIEGIILVSNLLIINCKNSENMFKINSIFILFFWHYDIATRVYGPKSTDGIYNYFFL